MLKLLLLENAGSFLLLRRKTGAGFGDFGNFWEVDIQRQTDLLQVNIIALVQLTRYFLPGMVERGRGSVLNLSSVAAFSAGPRMCLYYASKEFVRSFSEAVAEECVPEVYEKSQWAEKSDNGSLYPYT